VDYERVEARVLAYAASVSGAAHHIKPVDQDTLSDACVTWVGSGGLAGAYRPDAVCEVVKPSGPVTYTQASGADVWPRAAFLGRFAGALVAGLIASSFLGLLAVGFGLVTFHHALILGGAYAALAAFASAAVLTRLVNSTGDVP
jgi:hypothetical protein